MNRAQWRDRLENAAPEQVYETLCQILILTNAEDLIYLAPVITARIPELRPLVGFDQRSPHHAYDLYTHVAHVVEGVPDDLALRWAALLHDIGKIPTFTQDETGRGHYYGHAEASAQLCEVILRRLKAPDPLREQVVLLIGQHMTRLKPEKESLCRQLEQFGWDTMQRLFYLQKADMGSKGIRKPEEADTYEKIEAMLRQLQQE